MKLNTKIITIVIKIIVQLIGPFQVSLGIAYIDHKSFIHNRAINHYYLYQKEIKPFYYNHQYTYLHNHTNYSLNNTIITYPCVKKKSSTLFNKSRIYLQNDSINISHIFDKNLNKYQIKLPFVQLGMQNILSEKIISLGGGNRYTYNNHHAIGYNIFYHFPISSNKSMNQLHLININGEYWYNSNILFVLNNFYKINDFIYSKKLEKNNIKYPKYGQQIYVQIQPKNYLEFIGKITLEHIHNEKKIKKIFSNQNYHLILDMDYYPIPILGFNIKKFFINNKNNNVTYKILINYQFDTSIAQQTQHSNKNKTNSPIFLNFDTTVTPFIPTITNTKKNYDQQFSYCKKNVLTPYYKKITGYPGEIKIITINDNNTDIHDKCTTIQWDIQSLKKFQNYGGNIILLKNNTYAIHMPYRPINKKNKLILSYVIINDFIKKNENSHTTKQILILVRDFQKETILNSKKSHPKINHTDIPINDSNLEQNIINNDHQKIYTSTLNEDYCYNLKNDITSIISLSSTPNILHTNLTNNDNIMLTHHSFPKLSSYNYNSNLPSQYPTPINSLSMENITETTKNINSNNTIPVTPYINTTSSIPTPPPLPTIHQLSSYNTNLQIQQHNSDSKIDLNLNDNDQNNTTTANIDYISAPSSYIQNQNNNQVFPNNTTTNNNNSHSIMAPNTSFLDLLCIHKKSKFSKIGTKEHINKLDHTIIDTKKQHKNEMERIFYKLHLTQSTSSIDEPYTTDDDNN